MKNNLNISQNPNKTNHNQLMILGNGITQNEILNKDDTDNNSGLDPELMDVVNQIGLQYKGMSEIINTGLYYTQSLFSIEIDNGDDGVINVHEIEQRQKANLFIDIKAERNITNDLKLEECKFKERINSVNARRLSIALVGVFFDLCWEENKDPISDYIIGKISADFFQEIIYGLNSELNKISILGKLCDGLTQRENIIKQYSKLLLNRIQSKLNNGLSEKQCAILLKTIELLLGIDEKKFGFKLNENCFISDFRMPLIGEMALQTVYLDYLPMIDKLFSIGGTVSVDLGYGTFSVKYNDNAGHEIIMNAKLKCLCTEEKRYKGDQSVWPFGYVYSPDAPSWFTNRFGKILAIT